MQCFNRIVLKHLLMVGTNCHIILINNIAKSDLLRDFSWMMTKRYLKRASAVLLRSKLFLS